ncbi:MAG: UvrB/UvrC motif-containing protein [Candidatus Omnitrophica bacterium]|nr:UvrB/UvrC motif-containing protein [Candidatus Omnitrophota bacterium]
MLCDICHKNEAMIHITEIVNDEARELHVCQQCADAESMHMNQGFGIADLVSGMVGFPGEAREAKEKDLKCPTCGMAYSDFRKLGRLGCSECYEAFKSVLIPLLKNIHGSIHHTGKEPEKMVASFEKEYTGKKINVVTKEVKIAELREKLQRAVQTEQYEEAAVLRDRIKELEKNKI